MNRTLGVGVRCADPKCDVVFPFRSVTISTERAEDITTWTEGLKPKEITCPKCDLEAVYSPEDVREIPLERAPTFPI
jgi:hypothetical protein